MKSRRALSTVVGAVFAIIALTSTVTYVSYSMGILDNYNQSVLTKNQQLSDIDKEKFQISSVTVPNSKLNITVVNTGSVPINFTKMWIQNTTTTDWVRSYVPTHNFVTPGGVLTNIGQNSGVNINLANSYNVKLVTSRGNAQQFTVNSISSTKLNVQAYAFPSTVSSGFTTQIVMIVTNNSTGPIVNLTPSASVSPPQPPTSGNPTCSLGSMSPSKSDTILSGGTTVFTWPLIATGNENQVCTVTAMLPNGQSLSIPVTIVKVTLTSTDYAANAGLLTITYTSFQWIQNTQWTSGWLIPGGKDTGFAITIHNNNVTDMNTSLYISKQSQIAVYDSHSAGAAKQFYITKGIQPGSPSFSISPTYNCGGSPSNDYCVSIPAGGSATLYFAQGKTGDDNSHTPMITSGDDGIAFIILYGKFSQSHDGSGSQYGQNLPFVGILAS